MQTQTYAAYHDEHSAPFTWRTRSQQNLIFDVGPQYRPAASSMASTEEAVSGVAAAEAATEDDLNENRETTLLAASPSKILNARTAARYSRGNPCFAKPVQVSLLLGFNK